MQHLADAAVFMESTVLVDTCVITVPAVTVKNQPLDPVTHKLITPAPTTIYTGPCLFGVTPLGRDRSDSGEGAHNTAGRIRVRIPMSAVQPPAGAVIEITGSALDPSIVGTKVRVTAGLRKSHKVSRFVYGDVVEPTL